MSFLIKVIAQWFKDRNCTFAIYGADGSCIESANTTPKKNYFPPKLQYQNGHWAENLMRWVRAGTVARQTVPLGFGSRTSFGAGC